MKFFYLWTYETKQDTSSQDTVAGQAEDTIYRHFNSKGEKMEEIVTGPSNSQIPIPIDLKAWG